MTAAAGQTAPAPQPFDWARAMHAGLCVLRLSTDDFWAMTPRELHAAIGGLAPRAASLGRDGLLALMAAFPD